MKMTIPQMFQPALDKRFLAGWRFDQAYRKSVAYHGHPDTIDIRLCRPDGAVFADELHLLPEELESGTSWTYLERRIKALLWMKGGNRLYLSGPRGWSDKVAQQYAAGTGQRSFDAAFMERLFRQPFAVRHVEARDLPEARQAAGALGGNLKGCRIGFDLGGSDRKCAAVIDGEVVFSEEIEWDPYFQTDPEYHRRGIRDSLERAAAHLPRVDAIGGSAAGVYIDNEVRAGSLFRGLSAEAFDRSIRGFFKELQDAWKVPVAIVNDGDVTALAASLSGHSGGILGLAMGTSTAAGYVPPEGGLTPWLNELAFAPVDYCADAPVDEWSGDRGCGAQYFSQQSVARLGPAAGIPLEDGEEVPAYLKRVQAQMEAGDAQAANAFTMLRAR